MNRSHRIAVIPGDGIGTEVISEGIKCLKALPEIIENVQFEFQYFPWSSEYYLQHRRMMPEDGGQIKPLGWAQANVNLLTTEKPGDPISGAPLLKSSFCRIRKP